MLFRSTKEVLDSGKGRDPTLTACAREVWYLAAEMSTDVKIFHKPGSELVLADALSRAHQSKKSRDEANILLGPINLSRIRVQHTMSLLRD